MRIPPADAATCRTCQKLRPPGRLKPVLTVLQPCRSAISLAFVAVRLEKIEEYTQERKRLDDEIRQLTNALLRFRIYLGPDTPLRIVSPAR